VRHVRKTASPLYVIRFSFACALSGFLFRYRKPDSGHKGSQKKPACASAPH
jgi:hypothetical protein